MNAPKTEKSGMLTDSAASLAPTAADAGKAVIAGEMLAAAEAEYFARRGYPSNGVAAAIVSAALRAQAPAQVVGEEMVERVKEADQLVRDMVTAEDDLIAEMLSYGMQIELEAMDVPVVNQMRSYLAKYPAALSATEGGEP